MVAEAMVEDPGLSLNAATKRIGPKVGVLPDTLRAWISKSQAGPGAGTASGVDDAKRVKQLEAEVRELKRANEILLAASSFFARELDPRLPW